MFDKEISTDVLVIGSGIAGMRAAIQARKYVPDVTIVDKTLFGRQTLSSMAGGTTGLVEGYWSFTHPQSVDEFTAFHIISNAFAVTGIREQELEYVAAKEVVVRQDELKEYGVLNPRGQKSYGPPGRMGWANIGPMVEYVKNSDIKCIEKLMITDLIREGDRVTGVIGFEMDTGKWVAINAKATVLATGGGAEVYKRNNTPVRATGDGFVMAYRAGVQLSMMEFILFDAWICAEPDLPNFWIPPSYARTLGVVLNKDGEQFLKNYIPTSTNFVHRELPNLEWGDDMVRRFKGVVEKPATLDPNDPFHQRYGAPVIDLVNTISRGMAMEVDKGRGDPDVPSVYLDFSRVPEEVWLSEPKGVQGLHLLRNHDWKNKPVRMFPGALGNFGGCIVNKDCETSLKGLIAAGEVTYDVDSLRHANVFGVRAGDTAGLYAQRNELPAMDTGKAGELSKRWREIMEREPSEEGDPRKVKELIKNLMWKEAGVLKTKEGLERCLAGLDKIKKENLTKLWAMHPRQLREAIEAWNLAYVGEMIARCSMMREETRGTFNRLDFPDRDDAYWIRKTLLRLEDGEMKMSSEPLEQIYFKWKRQKVKVKGMDVE
jgi:succinate dehydrogenase/fumarate reductase flavoprotein subunit